MHQKTLNCSISQKEEKSIFLYSKIRVEFVKDTKFSDTGIFTILLEDHTLGNLVKM